MCPQTIRPKCMMEVYPRFCTSYSYPGASSRNTHHRRVMDRRCTSARCTIILLSVLIFHCKSARTNDAIVSPTQQSGDKQTNFVTESFPISPGRQKWISQIFVEVRERFVMIESTSEACKRDFHLYLRHLQNQTVWAVRSELRGALDTYLFITAYFYGCVHNIRTGRVWMILPV